MARSPRRLTDEAERETRAIAAAKGCDEKVTRVLVEAGVSVREVQGWLSTFSPEQAASWIEAGVSLDEARWWQSRSCSVVDMQAITGFEFGVDEVDTFRHMVAGEVMAAVPTVPFARGSPPWGV